MTLGELLIKHRLPHLANLEVPPGWLNLADRFFERLEKAWPAWRDSLVLVRPKHGHLDVRLHHPDLRDESVPPEAWHEVERALHTLEHLTARTCQQCGGESGDVTPRMVDWVVVTVCEGCRAELRKKARVVT